MIAIRDADGGNERPVDARPENGMTSRRNLRWMSIALCAAVLGCGDATAADGEDAGVDSASAADGAAVDAGRVVPAWLATGGYDVLFANDSVERDASLRLSAQLNANAAGIPPEGRLSLVVWVEDVSETLAAVALQGPTSRDVLRSCTDPDVSSLKYFRVTQATLRGIPVEISRPGYTGDLGYEIGVAADRALALWDALMESGQPWDITPTGMLALDVARIEAGLILLDVDYTSAKKALIPSQRYSPYEIGLGRLVHLDKAPYVGQAALRREAREGAARALADKPECNASKQWQADPD